VPQRVLWASTGTKDPQASDHLYIRAMASPNTVNTMPEKTLLAFGEHGTLGRVLSSGGGDAEEVIFRVEREGIDVAALGVQLQKEAAESFVNSWNELMGVLEDKARSYQ